MKQKKFVTRVRWDSLLVQKPNSVKHAQINFKAVSHVTLMLHNVLNASKVST